MITKSTHATRIASVFSSFTRAASAILVAAALVLLAPATATASSRIKDIVDFQGLRDNQLIGYGLVVGLDGDGDTLKNAPFTQQSLESMLERLGINIRGARNIPKSDNVAAVIVTANLPPFSRQGSRIDVTVSTIGDAEDLLGGTLLVTPLLGADGEVYAVAQGPVAVGGFSASGQGASVTKGVPTSGRIANGAIIERAIDFEFASMSSIELSLRNPDFTTSQRISEAINNMVREPSAIALDPGTVLVNVPDRFKTNLVAFVADIEQLRVEPDQEARVVIDEQSGIIVISRDVRISQIAIAQGNLIVRITETPQVSQPSPFAGVGQTEVVPRTEIVIEEGAGNKLAVLQDGVTLQDLVDGLNALGIGPRDMISILQAMKTAGALQAEIAVM